MLPKFALTNIIIADITRLLSQLQNEAFEIDFVNLATTGTVPEDCNILAIISPSQDLLDAEVTAITDYINKGGEIFFSMDVISQEVSLTNLQKVLDLYGVSVENGYVFECAANKYLSNYNYIYMPQVSGSSNITKDIYTDSFLWLVFTGRLNYKTDSELEALKVTKETLLSSSDESLFITNLSSDIEGAVEEATIAGGLKSSEVASLVTKKVTLEDGKETESSVKQSPCGKPHGDCFLSTAQCRADHGGILRVFGNHKVYREHGGKGGKGLLGIINAGEVSGQDNILDPAGARRKQREHANRFKHHVHDAKGYVCLGGYVRQFAKVGGRHMVWERHVFVFFGDITHAQVYVG